MNKNFVLLLLIYLIATLLTAHITIHKTSGAQVKISIFDIENITFELTDPPNLENMVFVRGGTFTPNNGSFTVTLSSFYMSKYETTQAEWLAVMAGNNNNISANPSFFTGDENRPVENVSWFEVLVYCNRLSIQEGLIPVYSKAGETNPDNWGDVPTNNNSEWSLITMNVNANGYRLPTGMEWEWAARGGSVAQQAVTFYSKYSGSYTADNVAWYNENSGNTSHPVGTKAPNELGLYDMSGNVYEWCWDYYYISFPTGSFINPIGDVYALQRNCRGGSWNFQKNQTQINYRISYHSHQSYNYLGFRTVRRYTF